MKTINRLEPPIFQKNNFDLIRIVTAGLVMVNHSLHHLKLTIPEWYTVIQQFQRVPMFFVMSGFLLSASFERNDNLRKYFRNRLTRIYPALWACILLSIILYATIGGLNFFNSQTVPWILAQGVGLIYTPQFMDHFGYGSYNGSLWTIVIELQFYLILPLIYLVCKFFYKGKSNKWFYILFALSILIAFVLKTFPTEIGSEKMIRYSFFPHAYIFMSGILLQKLKIWEWKIIQGKALYWMALFLIYTYTVPMNVTTSMISMIILACCTISLGYSKPGLASKILKNRDISYGVYLYHGMLLSILVEKNIIGNSLYFVFVVIFTFILAWLSYKYVEMPAMNIAKNKNSKARKIATSMAYG